MKRFMTTLLLLLLFGVALASCGNGDNGASAVPAAGTFVKNPAAASDGVRTGFFSSTLPAVRVQDLFRGMSGTMKLLGSGPITAIGFQADATVASAFTCPDVTIKMGHTGLDALTTTFADNVEEGKGGEVTVVRNRMVRVPAIAGGDYFTIELDTPFSYNGVDRLVVDFIRNGACTGDLDLRYDTTFPIEPSLYSADSTSTTGTLSDPTNMQFTFSGGVDAVELGGNLAFDIPFGPLHWRTQMLYLAGEINGSGPITGIGFKTAATTTAETYTYSLKLGHTKRSELGTTFSLNYSSAPVTVVRNGTFHVPAGVPANTYLWLPFPGAFPYNGTENLIVDLDISGGSITNEVLYTDGVGSIRLVAGPSGSAVASAGGGTDVLDTAFRFSGGTMDVISADPTAYVFPVANPREYVAQFLYDGAYLGSGGPIGSLAFRLAYDPAAAVDADVRIVLGHTALSALGTGSLAANFEGTRTTVFQGRITIPGDLKAGDWVTVPFQRPFTYDSEKNLVVQWDAPGLAIVNPARGSAAASRFGGHVSANLGDRTSDTVTYSGDFVMDMKLNLKK